MISPMDERFYGSHAKWDVILEINGFLAVQNICSSVFSAPEASKFSLGMEMAATYFCDTVLKSFVSVFTEIWFLEPFVF